MKSTHDQILGLLAGIPIAHALRILKSCQERIAEELEDIPLPEIPAREHGDQE